MSFCQITFITTFVIKSKYAPFTQYNFIIDISIPLLLHIPWSISMVHNVESRFIFVFLIDMGETLGRIRIPGILTQH